MAIGVHRDNTLVVVEDHHGRRASFSIADFKQMVEQAESVLSDIQKNQQVKSDNALNHGFVEKKVEGTHNTETSFKPLSKNVTTNADTK